MVPLNQHDLVHSFDSSFTGRGCIGVSPLFGQYKTIPFLSIEALRSRNINIVGIVFNGDENIDTESIIKSICGVPILGRIPDIIDLNQHSINDVKDYINI